MDAGQLFLRETALRLRQQYLPRLQEALDGLTDDDAWWRPHGRTTSIGVLLRHLEGNVRQWVLSGLAGESDVRQRRAEFHSDEQLPLERLFRELRDTVRHACTFFDDLDPTTLNEAVQIQGIRTTRLGAIYHVVEHFGWHLGQITWIAKYRKGPEHEVSFYDDEALNAARNE